MKLYSRLAITLICIQLCTSCNKESIEAHDAVAGLQTLPGVWELRSVYGGNNVSIIGDYEPGNGHIDRFTDDRYWFANPGSPTDSGSYRISSGINPATDTTSEVMIYNGDISWFRYFSIAGDTLTIYNGEVAYDGTIDKYVRIANPE